MSGNYLNIFINFFFVYLQFFADYPKIAGLTNAELLLNTFSPYLSKFGLPPLPLSQLTSAVPAATTATISTSSNSGLTPSTISTTTTTTTSGPYLTHSTAAVPSAPLTTATITEVEESRNIGAQSNVENVIYDVEDENNFQNEDFSPENNNEDSQVLNFPSADKFQDVSPFSSDIPSLPFEDHLSTFPIVTNNLISAPTTPRMDRTSLHSTATGVPSPRSLVFTIKTNANKPTSPRTSVSDTSAPLIQPPPGSVSDSSTPLEKPNTTTNLPVTRPPPHVPPAPAILPVVAPAPPIIPPAASGARTVSAPSTSSNSDQNPSPVRNRPAPPAPQVMKPPPVTPEVKKPAATQPAPVVVKYHRPLPPADQLIFPVPASASVIAYKQELETVWTSDWKEDGSVGAATFHSRNVHWFLAPLVRVCINYIENLAVQYIINYFFF